MAKSRPLRLKSRPGQKPMTKALHRYLREDVNPSMIDMDRKPMPRRDLMAKWIKHKRKTMGSGPFRKYVKRNYGEGKPGNPHFKGKRK